jgi:hypothetical protein
MKTLLRSSLAALALLGLLVGVSTAKTGSKITQKASFGIQNLPTCPQIPSK